MTDLLEELARTNPAPGQRPEDDARDAQVLRRVAQRGTRRQRRRSSRVRLAVAGTAALAAGLALLLTGLGREESPRFNAAARAYHAVAQPRAIYHFVSVSTITQTPRQATRLGVGFRLRSTFPFVLGGDSLSRILGRPQYEEDWITTDGRRVRWRKYHFRNGRRGRLKAAAAFTETVSPDPDTQDPASAFRFAYRTGQVRSRGPTRYANRDAWRFLAGTGGFSETWIVDRRTWLPLYYGYVERGQVSRLRYTNRQTVRFLRFEVLPLTARTEKLLRATKAERRVGARPKRRR